MRHQQICTTCSSSSRGCKGTHHMTQSKHLMLSCGSLLLSSMISVIFLHHFFAKYLVLLDQMIMWLLLISLCFSVMSVFLDPFSPSVSILRTPVMGWSAGERLLFLTQLGLSLNIGTDLFQKVSLLKITPH